MELLFIIISVVLSFICKLGTSLFVKLRELHLVLCLYFMIKCKQLFVLREGTVEYTKTYFCTSTSGRDKIKIYLFFST